MTGGDNAEGKYRSESDQQDQKKEDKHQRKDFSVEIIFSSIPYLTFCAWKTELYKDLRKPSSSKYSVLDKAWSNPKGNYYGPCDETIFIDCSCNNLDKFKNVTDATNLSLTTSLSYAITKLKGLLNRKSKQKFYGKVNVKIIAIHPCQKCMFALSALMGKKIDDENLYKSYVANILKLDEFRFTFRWIQKKGWEFDVKYCAIFDAYKAVLEDTKGNDERIKELKRIIDNHKSDQKVVKYFGTDKPYEWVEDEYERLTDPSEEQLRENVSLMKKQKAEVDSEAARAEYAIKKAMEEQNPYEMADVEIKNLRECSPKFKYKSDREIRDILQSRGLINFQHIKIINKGASGLQKALGIDTIEDQHAPVYIIDGAPLDLVTIENRKKAIQDRKEEAEENLKAAEQALLDKQMAFRNTILDCIQLVATIGSIAFPPLALVDVYISVARWAGGPKCSTGENVFNGLSIAMDIAGLIPYFGKLAKVAKQLSTTAGGEVMEAAVKKGLKPKISPAEKGLEKLKELNYLPQEELELVYVGNRNWDELAKSQQNLMLGRSKTSTGPTNGRNGIFPDSDKRDLFVTVKDSKGNITTVQMSYDSALKSFGSSKDAVMQNGKRVHLHDNSTIKASDLDKALTNDVNKMISQNEKALGEFSKELDTALGASEAAAKKASKEAVAETKYASLGVLKGLNEEIKDAAKIRSALGDYSENTLTELRELYKSQHSKLLKATSAASPAISGVTGAWTNVVGIGYNGASWILGLIDQTKYDPNAMAKKRNEVVKEQKKKPKWNSLKDKSPEQLDANKEYAQATKDLEAAQKANNKEAIESAKRRQTAAESLFTSQAEIKVYEGKETIKQAQSNLDVARQEEATAKKYYDQAHSNPQSKFFAPDAEIAYFQAKTNTQEAEEALNEAKMNDYALMMARVDAQFATEDINYEKEIYSTNSSSKSSSSKKSSKKSKK